MSTQNKTLLWWWPSRVVWGILFKARHQLFDRHLAHVNQFGRQTALPCALTCRRPVYNSEINSRMWTHPDDARLLRCVAPRCRAPIFTFYYTHVRPQCNFSILGLTILDGFRLENTNWCRWQGGRAKKDKNKKMFLVPGPKKKPGPHGPNTLDW